MTLCLYNAMAYLDVAVATMLLYTYPVMVALFSSIFYDERITAGKTVAIAGTFTGCLLVLNNWGGLKGQVSVMGIIFGILSAVFYSFMNIYSGNIVNKVPAAVVTFYSTVFSLLALLLFNYKYVSSLLYMKPEVYANAGMLAFFCEIIPLTLLYAAIKKIGPVRTSIISTLEIPVSALTAFITMGENLLPLQCAGIMLIVFSIMILRRE
jgi:drug/metabolite transporter (DMT)-like permease